MASENSEGSNESESNQNDIIPNVDIDESVIPENIENFEIQGSGEQNEASDSSEVFDEFNSPHSEVEFRSSRRPAQISTVLDIEETPTITNLERDLQNFPNQNSNNNQNQPVYNAPQYSSYSSGSGSSESRRREESEDYPRPFSPRQVDIQPADPTLNFGNAGMQRRLLSPEDATGWRTETPEREEDRRYTSNLNSRSDVSTLKRRNDW